MQCKHHTQILEQAGKLRSLLLSLPLHGPPGQNSKLGCFSVPWVGGHEMMEKEGGSRMKTGVEGNQCVCVCLHSVMLGVLTNLYSHPSMLKTCAKLV